MRKIVSVLLLSLALFSAGSVKAAIVSLGGGSVTPLDVELIHRYAKYDGDTVVEVKFNGLIRTKEQAVRWLMTTREGHPFDSRQLAIDVHNLYNTGDLYEIEAEVEKVKERKRALRVVVTVKDKWTLLPFAGAQGGGGALTYGGGVFDTNLFGYFINAMVQIYNYNGATSYDVNFYQEYIAGTQTMGSLDFSDSITPAFVHNIDNTSAGDFTWYRRQQEAMIGSHFENGGLRLEVIADSYSDGMLSSPGVNASVIAGNQYRLQPKLIIGRANIIEYLEDGYEITVHPSAANFFGGADKYQGLDVQYKNVEMLTHGGNFATNVFAGVMNGGPAPYQYEIGGYSSVRGYSEYRQIGPYTLHASVEYRPLLYKERLKFSDYFDFDWVILQGCVFSDAGSAWGDSTLTGDPGSAEFRPLWSAGAGFRLNFLHFAGAIMRFDFARTISPDEGWGFSFGVGQFF